MKDTEIVQLHDFKGFEYIENDYEKHYPKDVKKVEFFYDTLMNNEVRNFTNYEVYKDLL